MLAIGIFAIAVQTVEGSQIRVACVGDSITEGSKYPEELQLLLGSNYTVRNFGVSGSTVSLDSALPYMNQSAFKKAMDFQPDIVVIMLGTNDANPEITPNADGFETDYSQMISQFDQLDGPQLIWVVKSPPIFSSNSAYNNTFLAKTVIPQIDTVAKQMSVPTIDVYAPLVNHPDYFADGVHPNDDGASFIASAVWDAITLPDGSPDTSYFENVYIG